jgi:Tfp pilus assembly protein PilP
LQHASEDIPEKAHRLSNEAKQYTNISQIKYEFENKTINNAKARAPMLAQKRMEQVQELVSQMTPDEKKKFDQLEENDPLE